MRRVPPFFQQPRACSLFADRSGSVLPLFAIMVLLIIVLAGAAIDISRMVNAREKLSYAIDAAALSVASELSTTVLSDDQIKDRLTDSFETNLGDADFADAAIENIEFTVNSDEGIVTVSSSASLPNYFVDIGGYMHALTGPETFAFGASSQVTYSRFDVELALVVDVTGSMRSDMETLKAASRELVDILIPDGTAEDDSKVRVSLIPYSQGVNLGPYAEKVKGGGYHHGVSGKCVTERQDYDDGSNTYEVKFTDDSFDYYETDGIPPKGTFYGGGTSRCPADSEMLPLTAKRNDLLRAIRNLDDGGNTAGQTGITWGWNSLSPNYDDVWPSSGRAESYDNEDVLKFAVIMTDGDNNTHYEFIETEEVCTYRWVGWQYQRVCETRDVYDWRERGDSGFNGESSKSSRALCAAMKASGIQIFGVYFGSNNNSTGAKNMQACASPDKYYQATSSSALINAFSNIAKKIQQIYLSR